MMLRKEYRALSLRAGNRMKRALMLPRVAALGARAPHNTSVGWDRYWRAVRTTGHGGDVLWDEPDIEMPAHLEVLARYLDPGLPIIDLGCGNGGFTRLLAPHFAGAVGVDVSPGAIDRARAEAAATAGITFEALDATRPDAGGELRRQFGEANVFVRGLFHTLEPDAQVAMAQNALVIVGDRGRLFLAETDFRGSDLEYMQRLGAGPRHIPMPLRRAIAYLPRPGHFGEQERERAFPADKWVLIDDGPTVIHAVPMNGPTEAEQIRGYFAVLAPLA